MYISMTLYDVNIYVNNIICIIYKAPNNKHLTLIQIVSDPVSKFIVGYGNPYGRYLLNLLMNNTM